jgi:hypothetical protein
MPPSKVGVAVQRSPDLLEHAFHFEQPRADVGDVLGDLTQLEGGPFLSRAGVLGQALVGLLALD